MTKLAGIEKVLSALGAVCIVFMMVLTCLQVVSRLGRIDIPGLYESIELFMAGTIFLGLAATQAANEHIRVDTLVSALPARAQRWLELVVLVLSLCIVAVATYVTAVNFLQAVRINEVAPGGVAIPLWPAKLMVPLGLAVLLLRIVVQIGQSIAAMARGSTAGD